MRVLCRLEKGSLFFELAVVQVLRSLIAESRTVKL